MFRKVLYCLYKSDFFLFLKRLASRIEIDKESGLTLYTAILMISEMIKKNLIGSHSKAVAYNFTLAVFPTIIFLFTLIPFIADFLPIDGFGPEGMLGYLESVVPYTMYSGVESTVSDIVLNKKGDLLSFGFFFALMMATNGMVALMHTFNLIYKTTDKRGYVNKRVVALFLTIGLSLVLLSSVVILIFGDTILEFLAAYGSYTEKFIETLHDFKALESFVFVILFVVAISLIYYFAPAVTHRWNFISLGSVFASLVIISISVLFSLYINNFDAYNKVYGSIGTLIGFMIWVQSVSYVLILGYVINAGVDAAKNNIYRKKELE